MAVSAADSSCSCSCYSGYEIFLEARKATLVDSHSNGLVVPAVVCLVLFPTLFSLYWEIFTFFQIEGTTRTHIWVRSIILEIIVL